MEIGDRVKVCMGTGNLVEGRYGFVRGFGFTEFYKNTPPDYGKTVLVSVEGRTVWLRPSSLLPLEEV